MSKQLIEFDVVCRVQAKDFEEGKRLFMQFVERSLRVKCGLIELVRNPKISKKIIPMHSSIAVSFIDETPIWEMKEIKRKIPV